MAAGHKRGLVRKPALVHKRAPAVAQVVLAWRMTAPAMVQPVESRSAVDRMSVRRLVVDLEVVAVL